jgi:hypothetical protein
VSDSSDVNTTPTDSSASDASDSSDATSSDSSDSSSSDATSSDSSDSSSSDSSDSSSDSSDSSSSDSSDSSSSDSSDSSSSDSSDSSSSDSSDSSSSDSSDSSSSDSSDSSSSDGGTSSDSATPMQQGGSASSRGAAGSSASSSSASAAPVDFGKMVAIPSGINAGLTSADQATMLALLGKPGDLTADCSPITNAALKKLMVTQDVGPFKVTGLKPAVDALTRVFAAITTQKPALYKVLTTAGMTCCRAVRGSTTNYSNHSWGTAIDMGISGVLTPLGSTTVQEGIAEAAPFFQAEQFFWGAGYSSRKDGMHFEASHELITAWKAAKTI